MSIKIVLEKKGEIVTRTVSFIILFGGLLLSGCQLENIKLNNSWKTENFDKGSLTKYTKNLLDDDLLTKIKNNYANDPWDADYTELNLSAVYKKGIEEKLFVFLDVLYVEDIQVVYEVGHKGTLLNRFIYSEWQ